MVSYANEGKLPAIAKLLANGAYAENCLVPYPTVTPQNWTTLATGACLGTHGITGFEIHKKGEPFTRLCTAFDTSLCEAEYIWDAAEKAGKRSIIVNWPCIWPPTIKKGYQLGGAALAINNWRSGPYWPALEKSTWSDIQLFSTETFPDATRIKITDAAGWAGVDAASCRAAELKHRYSACTNKGDPGFENAQVTAPESWFMLVRASGGSGFDGVLLCHEKDASTSFAEVTPDQWTETLVHEFETVNGRKKAAFRAKLLDLSPEGDRATLLVTPLCAMEGFSFPDALAAEVSDVNPLALPMKSCTNAYNWGWFGEDTYLEFVDMENEWYGDVIPYLLQNKEWDLFFMHHHAPDWLYHRTEVIRNMDPARNPRDTVEYWTGIDIAMYQSLDRLIARIVETAGEDALVMLVSDHGAKEMGRDFSCVEALAEAGLTNFTTDPETGRPAVDCVTSRAVPLPQSGPWVFVNLKGRDPDGVVDPEDYDEVCDEIIRALIDYEDPETGDRPIAFALTKKDSRPMGLHGDRIGDVIYGLTEKYGGNHGGLPMSRDNIGCLKGLFVISGPGVRKNTVIKRTVGLNDVVPTLCYLTNTPLPRHSEGAVIHQALTDPNGKSKELDKLKKRYNALRKSLGDTSFEVDRHK